MGRPFDLQQKRAAKKDGEGIYFNKEGRKTGTEMAHKNCRIQWLRRAISVCYDLEMSAPVDNETWLVDTGGAIIEKMVCEGITSLTYWEKVVYCLWVADYGMRNAGDLCVSVDLHEDFQNEGRAAAGALSLRLTRDSFGLNQSDLERQYFNRFDSICDEVRRAEPLRGQGS